MNYNQCHIEYVDGQWGIYWPDNTSAWPDKYKSQGWATRTLNQLCAGAK